MGYKKKNETDKKFFTFKGRPLLRRGDTIYYGDVKDRFVIEMEVKSSVDVKGLNVADKVSVRLVDLSLLDSGNKKIIRISEKKGLYEAMNTAIDWLEMAKEFREKEN